MWSVPESECCWLRQVVLISMSRYNRLIRSKKLNRIFCLICFLNTKFDNVGSCLEKMGCYLKWIQYSINFKDCSIRLFFPFNCKWQIHQEKHKYLTFDCPLINDFWHFLSMEQIFISSPSQKCRSGEEKLTQQWTWHWDVHFSIFEVIFAFTDLHSKVSRSKLFVVAANFHQNKNTNYI